MTVNYLLNQQRQSQNAWGFAGFILILCLVFYHFHGSHSMLFFTLNDFSWWQFFTAHFIHYDSAHMINNLLALVLLMYLFPQKNCHMTLSFMFAMIFINIYLLVEQIHYYAGLSGLLYVIPGSAAMQSLLEKKYCHFLVIIACTTIYILSSLFIIQPQSHWSPLEQTHIIGFITGLLSHLLTNHKTDQV